MGLESVRPEVEGFSWARLAGHSLDMSAWGRSSVSALTDVVVISSAQDLSVLPDVLVSSSLLDEIAMTTSVDAFLSKVLCRVQESDTGSWRDFSLGVGGVIQYQRSEDLMPCVCVPHVCRAAVLRLCARSWLSGNLGKTALRLLEIMPMYYDTSLKTSRIDLSVLFSPRPLSRNGNFFFLLQGFGRKRDGRERRNPQGHGRHYACTN